MLSRDRVSHVSDGPRNIYMSSLSFSHPLQGDLSKTASTHQRDRAGRVMASFVESQWITEPAAHLLQQSSHGPFFVCEVQDCCGDRSFFSTHRRMGYSTRRCENGTVSSVS